MTRLLTTILIFLLFSILQVKPLLCCTCHGESEISEIKHFTYDVVFEGKLVRKVVEKQDGAELYHNKDTNNIEGNYYYIYTFEVSTIYRPEMFNNFFIDVYSTVSNGSCGINLELSKNYIVTCNYSFLEPIIEYNPDKYVVTDKKELNLTTNLCMHTRESNKGDLKKLDSVFYNKVIISREVISNQ